MHNEENKSPEKKSHYDQQIEYYSQVKSDIEKWRQEIEQSASIQNYLSQFQPQSVKSFIDSYLNNKNLWMSFGESCKEKNESEALQWETAASKCLEYIQQKKLFDLQCLWRAEKIQIDGIEICYDFEIWGEDILNCDFIEPVSEGDINLYTQFLLQDDLTTGHDEYLFREWQEYKNIKEAYNNPENDWYDFPDWYEFHNNRTGGAALMLLPDIRGEKEDYYEGLYSESIREKTAAQQKEVEVKMDKRPWIEYYKEDFIEWFVNTFENKQVREYYMAYKWDSRNNSLSETINDNVALLLTADEHVPIEAHYNWIEALERATQKFRYRKIAEALPMAFERYLINIETGIRFPEGHRIRQSVRNLIRDRILKGRVLNGEPADFNF